MSKILLSLLSGVFVVSAHAAAVAPRPQLSIVACNVTTPPVALRWAFSGAAGAAGAFSRVDGGGGGGGGKLCVTYDTPTTNLVVDACGAADAPLQTFLPRADGTIFSPSTSLCWDSQYYGNVSGSLLGLYSCEAPQEWDLFTFDQSTGLISNTQNGNTLCVNGGGAPPPLPTSEQLAWMDLEVSLMISYDIITQLTEVPNPQHFCIQAGGDSGFAVPPPTRFDPSNETFTDSWIAAAKAANAGYTLLVASHCAGFLQWQSNVKLPDGSPYPYTVAQSHWKGGKGDVVDDYVKSSNAAGLGFGFYLTWSKCPPLQTRISTLLSALTVSTTPTLAKTTITFSIGARQALPARSKPSSALPPTKTNIKYLTLALTLKPTQRRRWRPGRSTSRRTSTAR